ncbi:hypothetical protein CK203_053340 [Vitis vinifera]|uniref:Uncharacterized protein n=1 Tax=Vitis vinifera TaxID=29760 RepID=A0A438GWB5_VITVI|nr:hypothetical protein CK203_053340 [Vitis vinifera]
MEIRGDKEASLQSRQIRWPKAEGRGDGAAGLGIITFGDGDGWEKQKNTSSFRVFFNEYLIHYQAPLESMEWTFPTHFAEARIAMECLFVAPHVSSLGWFQKWEEMKGGDSNVDSILGLEGGE